MATSSTARRVRGLGRLLLGGFVLGGTMTAVAAPPVTKMLEYQPRHETAITTPAAAEHASCVVELVKGKAGGSGWALKDGQGKMVRRFFSSDGRSVDTYSYYRDGVEVYRELVSAGASRPDQFRWLNAGGSKWGVDEDKNGSIDSWKIISAEEVGQEVLKALATRDVRRMEACLITDQDIQTLGLPNDVAEDIKARRKGVKAKFDATVAKLTKLTEKAAWLHLETGAPQCLPADETGARVDLIKHARATVLFDAGGTSEWFQLGQMYLVGAAWKLIDAPVPGSAPTEERQGTTGLDDPKLAKLVEELTALDKASVGVSGAAAVKHHLGRADILEKIVAIVKPAEREPWIRQIADSISSAVQAATGGDATAAKRLASLEAQLVQAMEGSNLAGYVAFRRMQAEYSAKLGEKGIKDFNEVQKDWLTKLTGFVKAYPKADDTPDAMLQLGMVCEFLGKEVEAKNWYATLARTFADKPQAAKGEGAARRLSLEGETMVLAGPTLNNPTATFDLRQLSGKAVVVYYWASWNNAAAGDFTKIKAAVDAGKGAVDVICVNLDATADEAKAFLAKNPAPGTQLHTPGGLESKLATQYGVMVLPSLFVIGKDGKCVSKSAQVSGLEDEIKKALGEKAEKSEKK